MSGKAAMTREPLGADREGDPDVLKKHGRVDRDKRLATNSEDFLALLQTEPSPRFDNLLSDAFRPRRGLARSRFDKWSSYRKACKSRDME